MPPRNFLSDAPPYAVEDAIRILGANLRTARLRRNLTLADMAAKVGTTRFTIADAEKGKPTTGIAVYVGMLWALNLLGDLHPVADPLLDREGLVRSSFDERERARRKEDLSNDF